MALQRWWGTLDEPGKGTQVNGSCVGYQRQLNAKVPLHELSAPLIACTLSQYAGVQGPSHFFGSLPIRNPIRVITSVSM